MSNQITTEDLLRLREELKDAFNHLYSTFSPDGEGEICISDIQFSLYEFKGKLIELEDLC